MSAEVSRDMMSGASVVRDGLLRGCWICWYATSCDHIPYATINLLGVFAAIFIYDYKHARMHSSNRARRTAPNDARRTHPISTWWKTSTRRSVHCVIQSIMCGAHLPTSLSSTPRDDQIQLLVLLLYSLRLWFRSNTASLPPACPTWTRVICLSPNSSSNSLDHWLSLGLRAYSDNVPVLLAQVQCGESWEWDVSSSSGLFPVTRAPCVHSCSLCFTYIFSCGNTKLNRHPRGKRFCQAPCATLAWIAKLPVSRD